VSLKAFINPASLKAFINPASLKAFINPASLKAFINPASLKAFIVSLINLTCHYNSSHCRKGVRTHRPVYFDWALFLIAFPVANAIISMTFTNYALVPIFPDCTLSQHAVTLVVGFILSKYNYTDTHCQPCWSVASFYISPVIQGI